jgi:hypothetical protein
MFVYLFINIYATTSRLSQISKNLKTQNIFLFLKILAGHWGLKNEIGHVTHLVTQ